MGPLRFSYGFRTVFVELSSRGQLPPCTTKKSRSWVLHVWMHSVTSPFFLTSSLPLPFCAMLFCAHSVTTSFSLLSPPPPVCAMLLQADMSKRHVSFQNLPQGLGHYGDLSNIVRRGCGAAGIVCRQQHRRLSDTYTRHTPICMKIWPDLPTRDTRVLERVRKHSKRIASNKKIVFLDVGIGGILSIDQWSDPVKTNMKWPVRLVTCWSDLQLRAISNHLTSYHIITYAIIRYRLDSYTPFQPHASTPFVSPIFRPNFSTPLFNPIFQPNFQPGFQPRIRQSNFHSNLLSDFFE